MKKLLISATILILLSQTLISELTEPSTIYLTEPEIEELKVKIIEAMIKEKDRAIDEAIKPLMDKISIMKKEKDQLFIISLITVSAATIIGLFAGYLTRGAICN